MKSQKRPLRAVKASRRDNPDGALLCALQQLEERRLLAGFLGAAASPDRFEPNDSFAAATDLGVVSSRTENGLSIHVTGNDDYFRFVPSAGGQFTASIAFTNALGDLDMALFNSSQALLTVSEASTDFETISYPLITGQTYYLRVYGFEGAVNADYGLTVIAAITADSLEPNDSFATARNLGTVTTRIENNLTVHAPGNDDYYRFMPSTSGPFTAQISFTNALGDLDLILYEASGAEIIRADGSGDVESVVFAAVANQAYVVRVQGYASATSPRYLLYLDQAPGTMAGAVFEDRNASGAKDAGEAGLGGRTIYIDGNGNAQLDAGETSTVSDPVGNYLFTNVKTGSYALRQIVPAGWVGSAPASGVQNVNVSPGQNVTALNFGSFPIVFEDFAGGDDSYYVRRSPTQPRVQIWINATPAQTANYSIPVSALPSLTFKAAGGNDLLTVDLENGNPIPAGGISYQAGFQTVEGGDGLEVKGTGEFSMSYLPSASTTGSGSVMIEGLSVSFSGVEPIRASNLGVLSVVTSNSDDVIVIDSPAAGENQAYGATAGVAFDGITFREIGTVHVDTGDGADTLTIDGGTVNLDTSPCAGGSNLAVDVNNDAVVNLASSQCVGGLNIADDAAVNLLGSAGQFLRIGALSIAASAALDVGGNAVIVQSTSAAKAAVLANISDWIARGRNQGTWNGKGIASSAAAADGEHITGLAAIINDRGDGTVVRGELEGQPVDSNTILVKWTYNGDSDLSGALDADDYARIDAGFASSATTATYYSGDFDYNDVCDADDFFLIDRAHAGQGEAQSQAAAAAPAPAPASAGAVQKGREKSKEPSSRRRQRHHLRNRSRAPRLALTRIPTLWT